MNRKVLAAAVLAVAICVTLVVSFSLLNVISNRSKHDAAELQKTLKDFRWKRPAEDEVFDCSEMSAFLWQYLTNRGWQCAIVVGLARGHAWLLVSTEDEFITPVEPVIVQVIRRNDTRYQEYLTFDYLLPTLKDALDWAYDQFDYWKSYPYLP